MERILRINMTTAHITIEPVPDVYRLLGGRALTSRIVFDEVDPTCDALGPNNKLVWAPGILSGTVTSSTSRVSVGCKSPLTGGIKEANAGGETGLYLAQAGYRAIVVEGAPQPGTWYVLVVDRDGARLDPAPAEIMGKGNVEAASRLFAIYGTDSALALCGPSGEQKMMIAGITNTDRDRRPARLNARGGVGAVMGAKGIKALVCKGNMKNPVAALDSNAWKGSARVYVKGLSEHPSTSDFYPNIGTAGVLEKVNRLGGLPTRNFSSGTFELADLISGAHMREVILERGGEGMTTHSCMTGCAIRCSNVFPDKDGKELASSMEFETHGLMGSNLGIGDFDALAGFTRICNDLGVDTIETGGALGILMEAGVLAWGDSEAVNKVLDHDVRQGTPLGRIVGGGALLASRVYGIYRVPVVKGQTISAYDPRAIKGNGVTYASSAMGADHTAGNTIALNIDHLDPKGKVKASREIQIKATILDILGFCNFARGLFDTVPQTFVDMFNARTGAGWDWVHLSSHALDIIRMEVQFNRKAGLGPETDKLPEWLRIEPLPPHNVVFDVPDEEIAAIWEEPVV